MWNYFCHRFSIIAKSPVFSQMTATLTGISTIRASKAESRLALEFDCLQNVHSSVWQILMSVNTGEGVVKRLCSCMMLLMKVFDVLL